MSKRDNRREELEKIRRDAQDDVARDEYNPPPAPGFFAQIFSPEKDVNERYEDRETYEYAHESEVKRREEIKDELVEELAEAIREVREKRETASYSEFSPSPTYTNYTNTNIGTTTERDSSWGVATIISVIIVGISIIVGIIYYKEHNSGPLRHPEPTSFSVIINSSPSGATVFIDRKQVGLTPYSTTLEPGSYGISVEKEGYESAYGITEGENREFNFKLKED